MIKKQLRTIIICASVFVVLLIAYFAVVKPLIAEKEAEKEIIELLPGEILGNNGRVFMFEHVEKADMLSIEVHNSFGTYTFYRADDDNFYIKGMEGAPYSLEAFSSLVVSSGYTLAMTQTDGSPRLSEPEEDLSVYGLAESDNPAWYVITKMNGKTHKVYIGNPIPTGGGYYCRYDGRDAIYILDTTLKLTLLADVKSLITPSLGYPISTASYMNVDDFQIIRDGELFIWVDLVPAEESGAEDGLPDYVVKFPENYTLNLSLYSSFLEVFSNFVGTETVICGGLSDALSPEVLKEEYGIDVDDPYYLIHYKCDDIDTYITFSKPDEDGNVYAYSTVYNLVARIDPSTDSGKAALSILGVRITDFADPALFGKNINDVAKIAIKGNIANGGEELAVDAYFTLDGEKEDIIIKQNGESKAYNADEVKNFRQLYKSILGVKQQGISDMTDISKMTLLAEMDVDMDSGEHIEYKFYTYSTRRCFYTVNGKGEYYVLRDSVEKMLRDTDRMINGLLIDSDAKN